MCGVSLNCCVENVHIIHLLCMMRWSGHKSGNVRDVVNHHVIYYLPVHIIGVWRFRHLHVSFRWNKAFFHLVSCCVFVASLRGCVLACLADLLPVRAARQRVGFDHGGNQFALRMILLFIARTCDRALAVGMLAQEQWMCQVCRTRLLCCTEIRSFVL